MRLGRPARGPSPPRKASEPRRARIFTGSAVLSKGLTMSSMGAVYRTGQETYGYGRSDPSQTPLRIALADDHAEILEEIRSLLEPEFQVVCQANEGVTLVQAVDISKPDGVVADVQMPGLNGIEAGR